MMTRKQNKFIGIIEKTKLPLFLFSLAPLGELCTKRRHQSPEWTIPSHVNCFIQGEVVGFSGPAV